MTIYKQLKERLNEKQIKQYEEWEKHWSGKNWGNEKLDELLEIVLPGYKRKGEVIGVKKKVLIKCSNGHDWEVRPVNIAQGKQCPECFRQKRVRDVHDVYQFIFKKFEIEMDMSTYEGMKKPAKFKCKYGNWFWSIPSSVENGKKKCQCANCKKVRGRHKRRTKQEYIDALRERGFSLHPNDWEGPRVITKLWCNKGQHWTYQKPASILNSNNGCAVCSGKVPYNIDKLQKELFDPEGYSIKEDAIYKNIHMPITLICPKGHECKISVVNFRDHKHRCRHCHIENISGEGSPNYDHNKTEEERKELEKARKDSRYWKVRELSQQRDKKVCVICGMTEKEAEAKGLNHVQKVLNGHHLFSFTTIEKARYVLDNWITLCYWCHQDDFHAKYGRDGTTNGFQFLEWIESKDVPDELKETIRERVERVYGFIESNFDNYDDYLNHIGKSKKGTA